MELVQGLRHCLGSVGRMNHLLLGCDEHVGGICGRDLVAESALNLSLVPDGGLQLLIYLEVLEADILILWQQSLLCLLHGLPRQRIFGSLLFVRAVLLGVARVVALNDINRLFNGLVIADFINGLH